MTQAEWNGVFDGIHLRLIGRGDGIIRVTRDLDGSFRERAHAAVCPCPAGTWEHRAAEDGDIFLMPGLEIRADRRTGSLSFFSGDGKLLLRERCEHPAELEPAEICRAEFSGEAAVLETTGADGIRASASPSETRLDRMGIRGKQHFEFSEDEGLYGLGSHEEGFGNLRGHARLLYQHNLKAVVPVLVSTGGWAVLFDMGCMMRFHDDAEGSFLYTDCADTMDWYFIFGGGSYGSLAEKIRSLTGPAPLLPRYVLGFTQSKERYVTADELAGVAEEYRRRKIPLDLIVQDWQTWPDGQWGLKRFDRCRYPEGFADRLHSLHVRVMLSIWPNLQGGENSDREELLREGCMLGNRTTYNAFMPKAREIYWRQVRDGLLGDGIDAWWCDCTEPFECDWHGEERPSDEERMRVNTGEAMKYLDPTEISLYSLCHSRGIYEGFRRDGGGQRVLNVTRSSWSGQHRYAAVTWSGDVCATWETLRRHIPEGLNFTATGEPYWNCDIGGFFSDTKEPWFWRGDFPSGTADPGYRELFVRWTQYACFLTMMRAHGTDTPREIWQFGEAGEPFYDAIADSIRLRYRLAAYQYALMAETHERGIPALRIPALVFPEDAYLRETDHEMMLGDQMLIRPVTRPMYYLPGGKKIGHPDETADVYLPAGHRWYTPDGRQAFEGGQTVTVPAPLNTIPVFIRAGSVLPLSPARQYTDENPDAATELVVYPGRNGSAAYYNDDGISYDYERGLYQKIPLVWNDREGKLTLAAQEGQMRTARRFTVRRCGEYPTQEVLYTGDAVTVSLPE